MVKTIGLTGLLLLIVACSSGRYAHKHDSAPLRKPTAAEMENPKVVPLTKSRQGNAPYEVWGQHYSPIKNATGYTETGYASWYGRKFHGHLTSNGEVYDMFAMTAAHKTLPLPSFVKVTNIENNRSAIVRVNDRGPFHPGRVIDLSYAAAYKLGVYKKGTAKVEIEVISLSESLIHAIDSNKESFIQVLAASNKQRVRTLADSLRKQHNIGSEIHFSKNLYRLRLGPIIGLDNAENMLKKIKQQGYSQAFLVPALESHH